jgi:iron complex transport system permease protein
MTVAATKQDRSQPTGDGTAVGAGVAAGLGAVPVAGPAIVAAYRLPRRATALTAIVLLAVTVLSVAVGPFDIPLTRIGASLVDRIPGVGLSSSLSAQQEVVLWQWRLPRAVLGGLVGAALALSGATYQGVFRNPLADPYLLGVAAGAGLGATLVIVGDGAVGWGPFDAVAAAAFVGAIGGVALASLLGHRPGSSPATLLLAGVAVASFLTALQTFVVQRSNDDLREVYTWILGRLGTSGWGDVAVLAPYVLVCGVVILAHRRHLDVLRLGDAEAASVGVDPRRIRLLLIVAASLLAAAAVAVSGLISFVGIVVPHLVRLLVGSSYRAVLPLSALGGAAFLMLADLVARSAASPAEVPIGVVTAFVGAPFFAFVLWTTRRELR